MTDDEKVIEAEFETVTEYEVDDGRRGEFEKALGDKLSVVIDETFKQGATIEEVVGAVGQVLYSLVTFDNGHLDAGKVLSVLMEPYECGCLCIQVRQTTPRITEDDAVGCGPN
jgi:hypothetical protein